MIPAFHATPGQSLLIATLSFRGDLELCRLMCETMDRFVPEEIPHLLAVPRADMALFAPMANRRRTIITQQELLPPWLHRIPMPNPRIRRLLRLPRRDVYFSRRGGLIRGWIAQQMMKIEVASRAETDAILHVDSDVAFVRPLRPDHVFADGMVRFLRRPGDADTEMHRRWHAAAGRLLGLPPRPYYGADYIDVMIPWRPQLVRAMLAHIREVSGKDPFEALAGEPDFSEYILYGIHAEHIVGLERNGHYASEQPICATIWSDVSSDRLAARLDGMAVAADQVAVGIQSTIPVGIEERRRLLDRLIARQA